MSTVTKRQAFNKYISGCTYYGMEPAYQYEEQTAKQFVAHTNALWRRDKAQGVKDTATSIAKNTEHARNVVKQAAGETRKAVMDRAKALKSKVPFTITVLWK